ncbi:MAG TPA: SRPBCC family protein [Cyclobacteriaceae bacterium]|nr:SRPBCC family protein [Cyclobacteriaceae bacterium]
MKTNTVSLHRIINAGPEKVFRAFSDPIANATWFPPYGFICAVHQMDFHVGGKFKMTFVNFTTGSGQSFGGEYIEIIPNELIKYSDRFDDPQLPGEITTTVRLSKVSCGTSLEITQDGIPDAIPSEICYLGWQDSLDKLIKLVERDIPDT